MKLLTILGISPLLLTLPTPSFGLNICAYSSRGCIGGATCCNNIAINTCCTITGAPTGAYGWSVKFSNPPATWYGMVFGTPYCSTMTGGGNASGSGGICVEVYPDPNRLAFQSARWQATFSGKDIEDGEASSSLVNVDTSLCMTPNGLLFTTPDGVDQNIDIPEGQMERAVGLMEEGRYNELLKFKTT